MSEARGTKNLGFIKSIHDGITPPLNTKMIWFDTNTGVNRHKVYNYALATWVPFIDSEAPTVGPGGTLPYKIYTALVTSTSTAPFVTVTVLQNTIGNIVWSRVVSGEYDGVLVGAFPLDKTFCIISNNLGGGAGQPQYANSLGVNVDRVILQAQRTDGTVGGLLRAPIEIRVYD